METNAICTRIQQPQLGSDGDNGKKVNASGRGGGALSDNPSINLLSSGPPLALLQPRGLRHGRLL
uniref:Uncharacterized protein n=1 Tax=Arundo donax TaxID=35708 RepID=A0A0A9TL50_ARUDO